MNNLIKASLIKLKKKNINNPELDLKILLQFSSKKNKEILLSNLNIQDINVIKFKNLLNKRLKRQPISKIVKNKFFWKSRFYVNKFVLDPRPETEYIIEEIINNYKNKNEKLQILDIGTGSGCIAISLAKEFKNATITAIDISKEALLVARKNIKLHNCISQIKTKKIDFRKIKKKYDIIVSNPPYLTLSEFKNAEPEVKKFEPKIALVAGSDGLDFYRSFAIKLSKLMKKNSYFFCEIGHNQKKDCLKIFKNSDLQLIKITKDLQKIDRILTFLKI